MFGLMITNRLQTMFDGFNILYYTIQLQYIS